MAGTKVFVSSTCYDLIDVRAEVEQLLRNSGFSPVMSDSKLSDFQMNPGVDSIETCLENIRSSDLFVMILSRRYGPSLVNAGFDNVSATHLEYREARKHNKRIFVYVRDRLAGAYAHWKTQGRPDKFPNPWVEEKDTGLFVLMDEHAHLEARGCNNWYTSFMSSTDLKTALSKDLYVAEPSAILRKLVSEARVPELRIRCTMVVQAKDGASGKYSLIFNNYGTVPAYQVAMRITTETDGNIYQKNVADAIMSCSSITKDVEFGPVDPLFPFTVELLFELSDGMQIGELFGAQLANNKMPVFVHQGKWHIGQSNKVFATPVYSWAKKEHA